ncbi:hypothetical protein JHK82_050587 [Glycine max]|nr:hypothetical protein JHK85_051296 [Glycine max]KAG5091809.1 hypothetical protein JHK82_050587 [Glycine max]KAG5094908.1 hypothetical protein JHK84_050496 [Glycine max]
MLDGTVRLPRQLFSGEAELGEMAQLAKGRRDLLKIFKELNINRIIEKYRQCCFNMSQTGNVTEHQSEQCLYQ